MSGAANDKGAVMKLGLTFLAVAIALLAVSPPVSASSATSGKAMRADELSAAARNKTNKKVVYRRHDAGDVYARKGIVPSMGYVGPPGYPGEYAWRKSIGQCVTDMGYGRWSACDSP